MSDKAGLTEIDKAKMDAILRGQNLPQPEALIQPLSCEERLRQIREAGAQIVDDRARIVGPTGEPQGPARIIDMNSVCPPPSFGSSM